MMNTVRDVVRNMSRLSCSTNFSGGYAYVTPSNDMPRAVPLLYPLFRGGKTDKVSIGNGFIVGSYKESNGYAICSHGVNKVLQLGSPSKNHTFDKKIWGIDERILELRSGRAHTLALTESGNVFGWGSNNLGQLGYPRSLCKAVNFSSLDFQDMKSVAVGLDNSFLLTSEGAVLSCGWAADGQTGSGSTSTLDKFTPVNIPYPVKKISSSADSTLVLCENGMVYGWGNNEYHQISPSPEMQMVSPTQIDMSGHVIVDIVSGGSFSLFLSESGQVLSCGYGAGIGRSNDSTTTPVVVPTTHKLISISASLDHAAGITAEGNLVRWGRGQHHKLVAVSEEDIPQPELLDQLKNKVIDVVCGTNKTCVITSEPIKSVSNLGMIEGDEEDK